MARILIVEDDLTFATMMQTWLRKKGFEVDKVSSVLAAEKSLSGEVVFDLILSDLRLPDGDGLSLLGWKGKHGISCPFIVMTHYAEVQNAVLAMKSGASDYIAKPVQPELLLQKINDALRATPSKVPQKEKPSQKGTSLSAIVKNNYLEGNSPASRQLAEYISLVAPTPMSVLILGASGTGKEYVARLIHEQSKRADGPFVALDCGAIPRDVAASEFFGYLKGAFTGADTNKKGAFKEADGGTLFLDEIGNLSYDIQVQLLRALQQRSIRPLGSNTETPVDIRLICATNEDLQKSVAEGDFREDLFHRLNEFTIYMPELKDRGSDLYVFADFFLSQANEELGRKVLGFDDKASEMLARHSWPGNLRELKNVVKRATLLAKGGYITQEDLSKSMTPVKRESMILHDEDTELSRIKAALRATGGNKTKTAKLLAIDRKTLYNKMQKYGLD